MCFISPVYGRQFYPVINPSNPIASNIGLAPVQIVGIAASPPHSCEASNLPPLFSTADPTPNQTCGSCKPVGATLKPPWRIITGSGSFTELVLQTHSTDVLTGTHAHTRAHTHTHTHTHTQIYTHLLLEEKRDVEETSASSFLTCWSLPTGRSHCNCTEIALKVNWELLRNCTESALKGAPKWHWKCCRIGLNYLENCSEIALKTALKTALKLLWNCSETALIFHYRCFKQSLGSRRDYLLELTNIIE